MESNDNSVNINVQKRKKPAYDLGGLCSGLVKAGLELLENRDADEIGLRKVARHIGVSATAMYRHFRDKSALFRILAHKAIERLADMQQKAARAVGGPGGHGQLSMDSLY